MNKARRSDGVKAVDSTPTALSDLFDEYATDDQLAAEINMSKRTIERWVAAGLLPPPVRLGRLKLHHLPSIKLYLADQIQTADSRNGRHRRLAKYRAVTRSASTRG